MALVTTFGKVEEIKVGHDFCFIKIKNEVDDTSEFFVLWFFLVSILFPDPADFSTSTDTSLTSVRILHSMHLSLLREAFTNDLRVGIRHEESESGVRAVFLKEPSALAVVDLPTDVESRR